MQTTPHHIALAIVARIVWQTVMSPFQDELLSWQLDSCKSKQFAISGDVSLMRAAFHETIMSFLLRLHMLGLQPY